MFGLIICTLQHKLCCWFDFRVACLRSTASSGWLEDDMTNKYLKHYIYIYAFSRRFYPKRLTGYTFFHQFVRFLGIEPTTVCAVNTMLYH